MDQRRGAPRILWITRSCLLDRTSGASLSVRQMLLQLCARGYEVEVLGASVFDAGEGPPEVAQHLDTLVPLEVTELSDGLITHRLVKTASPRGAEMRLCEIDKLFTLFLKRLAKWRPDLVWLYGGKAPDLLTLSEAKRRGVATAFYLANGSYSGSRWHRDVDLVLTDSQATADLYRQTSGINPIAIGKFIPREEVLAPQHAREYVTFINPKPEKGAYLVAQIAMALEKKRPDIRFEVVESRGRWKEILESISGGSKRALSNVVLTPNTSDMRPIYGRSRVLLAPSLWWESGSRVTVEAMLNGVPAVVTNRGGQPEMIGEGGVAITLPEPFHEAPYGKLLPSEGLAAMTSLIERICDDEAGYQSMVQAANRAGRELHDIEQNTDNLVAALSRVLSATD